MLEKIRTLWAFKTPLVMQSKLRPGITKTRKEWKVIDKKIRQLSTNKKLNDTERYARYINKKISCLIEDYEKCPDCVQHLFPKRNTERKTTISPVWHEKLISIAKQLDVSVPTLLDRVILMPLLIEI